MTGCDANGGRRVDGFGVELVGRVGEAATAALSGGGGEVVDVVGDPLDGSVWLRLTSWSAAQAARDALTMHGLASVDGSDRRLHVTGWDARLLRRRLASLLAGVDDLREEWTSTTELARYLWDRRANAGEDPDPVEVVADVERALRSAAPLPHLTTGSDDVPTLLVLVEAADSAYQDLLAQHLEHAARAVEEYGSSARLQRPEKIGY